jgi:hypothetical protein
MRAHPQCPEPEGGYKHYLAIECACGCCLEFYVAAQPLKSDFQRLALGQCPWCYAAKIADPNDEVADHIHTMYRGALALIKKAPVDATMYREMLKLEREVLDGKEESLAEDQGGAGSSWGEDIAKAADRASAAIADAAEAAGKKLREFAKPRSEGNESGHDLPAGPEQAGASDADPVAGLDGRGNSVRGSDADAGERNPRSAPRSHRKSGTAPGRGIGVGLAVAVGAIAVGILVERARRRGR